MSKIAPPELRKYVDKLVYLNIQGNRKVTGVLRGFDVFMNLVVEEARDETNGAKTDCGTVVVRGNSITSIEQLPTRT